MDFEEEDYLLEESIERFMEKKHGKEKEKS